MTERERFEAALKAAPYDWKTRKVYSDWLEEHGFDDEATEQRLWSEEWQKSMDWLAGLAGQIKMPVEELIDHGRNWSSSGGGDYVRHEVTETDDTDGQQWGDGGQTARDLMSANYEDYWKHFEVVTRMEVEDRKKQSFFTCSC